MLDDEDINSEQDKHEFVLMEFIFFGELKSNKQLCQNDVKSAGIGEIWTIYGIDNIPKIALAGMMENS